ncbi:hypothetical protein H3Z83_12680 [Tenacibaculum sp. S7007]|uniref:DUF3592 domain-containing protein n=1 Tax=Tenacibaculum pelagium TaxID=2759527 RepID=A0A839AQK9_9FLAO|nr:hypothetical protein [Tenacibaculum pelagium]MBA6157365.1 hypothetical protein [Tenacibaculum pelagium]
MNEDKLKGYLLIVGIALIVLLPIVYIISSKIKSKELNSNGIKSTAIVQRVERNKNVKTRTFSYFITLKYQDYNNNEYSETLPIDFSEYRKRVKGQEIEILYDKMNPKNIEILDYKKFKKTEERILFYEDLIDFQNQLNPEYILDKLNKISYGWEIREKDSSFFINRIRQSYLIVKKDTTKYITDLIHNNDITKHIEKTDFMESEKMNVGYIYNPFLNIEKPKKNISMTVFAKNKIKGECTLKFYDQIDYKRKLWNVMSSVK